MKHIFTLSLIISLTLYLLLAYCIKELNPLLWEFQARVFHSIVTALCFITLTFDYYDRIKNKNK